MHSGKGGSMNPIMPWTAFSGLTDDDLGAMYDALSDAHPVAHYVGNIGEPRQCEVCGQEHPLGEYNRLVLPRGVPVAAAVLERLSGTYRSDEAGWTIVIRRDGDKLYARENDSTKDIELIALTETATSAPGLPAPIEFTLPVAGATRLVSLELQKGSCRAHTLTPIKYLSSPAGRDATDSTSTGPYRRQPWPCARRSARRVRLLEQWPRRNRSP
jgi:hypothetical protein